MKIGRLFQELRWFAMAALFAACLVETASAAAIWAKADYAGNWSDAATWQSGVVPTNNTTTDEAILFSGSTVTVNSAASVGGMYNNGFDQPNTAILNVAADFTIGTVDHWNGCSFFLVGDTRQVTLNQTAGVTTGLGKMSIGCDSGVGIYNLSSGATLNATNGIWIAENTAGNGGGTGTININGTAIVGSDYGLTMNGGTSTVNLNSGGVLQTRKFSFASSGNKTINLNGGTIKVDAAGGGSSFLPTGSTINVQSGGATFDTNGGSATVSGALNGSGALTKSGSGTLILSGGNSVYTGTATISAGTLQIGDGADAVSWGGAIKNNASLVFNNTNDLVLSSKTTDGTGTLVKNGAGKLTIGNSTSYFTGGITVNDGALTLANWFSNSTANGGGNITVNNQKTVTLANTARRTWTGAIHGDGAVVIAGTARVTMNSVSDYTGGTTINAGSELMLGNGSAEGMVAGNIANGGTLTFYTGGSATVRNSSYTGVLSGSGMLIADGYGRISLSGVNTYSGATLISNGTLSLSSTGSIADSTTLLLGGTGTSGTFDVSSKAEYSLDSGKTLSGNGTVLGAMSIADGASLAPCAGTNSIGSLAFNNALTLVGSTSMDVSRVGSVYTSDLITVATSLTLGGRLTVTAAGDTLSAGDTWDLFNAASFKGAFSSFALPTLGTGLTWNTSRLAVDGTLSVATVPEPGSISMATLAMFGLIAYAWRKRK